MVTLYDPETGDVLEPWELNPDLFNPDRTSAWHSFMLRQTTGLVSPWVQFNSQVGRTEVSTLHREAVELEMVHILSTTDIYFVNPKTKVAYFIYDNTIEEDEKNSEHADMFVYFAQAKNIETLYRDVQTWIPIRSDKKAHCNVLSRIGQCDHLPHFIVHRKYNFVLRCPHTRFIKLD